MTYPYQESFFSSFDGTKLYCREVGNPNAPLLLMIHGACTDADCFKDTAEYLAKSFHVITYDRRGCARSELLPEKMLEDVLEDETLKHSSVLSPENIMKTHVEDAVAVIHRFDEEALVIGHSLGGALSLKLAELHPECVERMVLHEPVSPSRRREGSSVFHTIKEAQQAYLSGDMPKAFGIFSSLAGENDPRGRLATEEEFNNIGPDSILFFEYDLPALMDTFTLDTESLNKVPFTIGVGEYSKGQSLYEETLAFAEQLQSTIRYFPGSHNCCFDLPFEFAALCTAMLI